MDTKALEQERAELNALINKGIPFEVTDTEFEVKTKLFGLIKKRIPKRVKKRFKINELTLGTLDRLSAEWIEFAIDEERIQSDDGMKRARILTKEHSLRCAKIVALAVLDADYLIPTYGKNGVVRYVEDTEKLADLTALFSRTIKPSKLYQLNMLINTMCNLGDFVNSIRLMCADRTTMPIRIEQNNVG
ncbi:hypothetical protein FACS189432_05060 [Bacteroidia bacterium]|nr:hypothetical protein FACS189426_06710 [Bacteroidia bacterium]GHT27880.1 hypothetical protein FACS189432_05060 [Bacteroidia bacterium]